MEPACIATWDIGNILNKAAARMAMGHDAGQRSCRKGRDVLNEWSDRMPPRRKRRFVPSAEFSVGILTTLLSAALLVNVLSLVFG